MRVSLYAGVLLLGLIAGFLLGRQHCPVSECSQNAAAQEVGGEPEFIDPAAMGLPPNELSEQFAMPPVPDEMEGTLDNLTKSTEDLKNELRTSLIESGAAPEDIEAMVEGLFPTPEPENQQPPNVPSGTTP